jgi:sulfonate transport system permease protein
MATTFKREKLPPAYAVIGILIPFLLVFIWQLYAAGKKTLLGTPWQAVLTLWGLAQSGQLFKLMAISLDRVLEGFLIGGVIGLLFGILTGSSKTAEKMLLSTFHAIRQVPMVAWIPLIVMWFGKGGLAQIVFISLSAFYPMALNTFSGIKGISPQYLEVGQVFELTRWQMLKNIYLPAALSAIKTGSILSLNMAWTLLVAAEIMTSEPTGGLGDILSEGRETFNMSLLISGMIIMGGFGYLLNLAAEKGWQIALRGQHALR